MFLAILGTARGGPEEMPVKSVGPNPIEEQTAAATWNGDLGFSFVSAYISFGILQENQGAIAEPYFDVYHTLFRGDGWVNNVTLGLQLWSSIHSEETGAARNSPVKPWYEFDYFIPFSVTMAKQWTLTISYFEYDIPNGAFPPQRGMQEILAFDDSDLLGAWALHPHILVLYNFDGVLGIAKSHAWYGEVGITPGFTMAKKATYPVTFTFPLTVGVGDAHFYPKDAYGYFSAAINGSVPLAFLPKSFGAWTANAGFTYYDLGNATAAVNANGDDNAYVGQIGVGFTF